MNARALAVIGALVAALGLAGCETITDPARSNLPDARAARPIEAPVRATPVAPAVPPVPVAPPAPCVVNETLAQLTVLQGLGLEEQRREHLAAQQAYQGDPTEANRLRLILTLSLPRFAWRDDARVQRLLETAEAPIAEGHCGAGLAATLLRLSADRLKLLREEQRRHDVQIKEEQRNHELAVREEQRRYDTLLRDERQRNVELKQKLDALLEIDRRMRRDTQGPRR